MHRKRLRLNRGRLPPSSHWCICYIMPEQPAPRGPIPRDRLAGSIIFAAIGAEQPVAWEFEADPGAADIGLPRGRASESARAHLCFHHLRLQQRLQMSLLIPRCSKRATVGCQSCRPMKHRMRSIRAAPSALAQAGGPRRRGTLDRASAQAWLLPDPRCPLPTRCRRA